MTSQPGKQIITINILSNIVSRNTCNQPMNFGRPIEYNMRNIFVEKQKKSNLRAIKTH